MRAGNENELTVLVDRLRRDRRRDPYAGRQAYSQAAREVADHCARLIDAGDAAVAVPVLRKAVDRMTTALMYMDSSSGVLGNDLAHLMELYARACRAAPPRPAGLAAWLVRLVCDGPGWPDVILREWAPALGAKGLAEMTRLVKQRAAVADPDNWHQQWTIRHLREQLAEVSGDVDRYVAVLAEHLVSADQYERAVRVLAEAGRPADAIDWARRGLAEHSTGHQSARLRDLLVGLLIETGDPRAAVAERRAAFDKQPTIDNLRSLLATVAETDRDETHTEWALTVVRHRVAQQPGYLPHLIDALHHIGRDDEAWHTGLARLDESAWGRRLHRLEPDPATAPWVRWIFEQRLAGYSVASIARRLNDNVPCPSGADPTRNRHRSGHQWMLITVAAILANPRYTGRQVWNRQRTDHDDLTSDGTVARHGEVQRWNVAPQWVISREIAHPPLVTEEQFVAAQAIHTAPTPADGAPRHYLLAGLVCCGVCGRIMDSHWVHGRPGYRCRHGHTSTRTKASPRPKILYIREDHLLDRVQHDQALHRNHPRLRSLDPENVAAYLRTNNMIIVRDHRAWTVEAEAAVYTLSPAGSFVAAAAKIPAQRDGDHAKHEEPSRFVWK